MHAHIHSREASLPQPKIPDAGMPPCCVFLLHCTAAQSAIKVSYQSCLGDFTNESFFFKMEDLGPKAIVDLSTPFKTMKELQNLPFYRELSLVDMLLRK